MLTMPRHELRVVSPGESPTSGPSDDDIQAAISTGAKAICRCLLGYPATEAEAWAKCDYPEQADYLRAAEACLIQAVPVLFRKDLPGKQST